MFLYLRLRRKLGTEHFDRLPDSCLTVLLNIANRRLPNKLDLGTYGCSNIVQGTPFLTYVYACLRKEAPQTTPAEEGP